MTFSSAATLEVSDIASIPTDLFIGGKWVVATGQTRFDVANPANERVLASVADAQVMDGIKAVDAAALAGSDFAKMPPRQRAEILRKCFELMQRDSERLARIISLENGKALGDSRGEVAYAAEFFRWFAEEAVRINGDISIAPSGNNRILVQYQPIGIALMVTPWNFPAAMATRKIAPALAAGCSCILKPAAETPLTALAIAEILREGGVPDGVVNVITTSRSSAVVDAILHDPRVRKLSFTGSTEVGRILLRGAADQVINSSMELGGNAPFIVFDDAVLDAAVEGAMIAKMRNGGEACTAANRFYVQRGIAETFTARLSERMKALVVGEGIDERTNCGPLINAGAVAKVSALVKDAVSKGARVMVGGEPLRRVGHFFTPTVLTDVPDDANILNQEIFGPVAPIVVFDDEAKVIELANATEYGLVTYVYTRDLARGLRISESLESGMIALNRGLVSDPAAPFGGLKQSGLGREGAHHGMLEFMEAKYIATNW